MTTCMVGNVPVKLQNIIPNKDVLSTLQFAPYDCLLEKEIQLTTWYFPGMLAKPRSTKRTALCAGSASGVTDPCLYYAQTAQQPVALSARPEELLRLTLPLPRMAVVRLRDAHCRERKGFESICFHFKRFSRRHHVATLVVRTLNFKTPTLEVIYLGEYKWIKETNKKWHSHLRFMTFHNKKLHSHYYYDIS